MTFLAFGYRLLPGGRKGSGSAEAAFNIEDYTTEAALPAGSPMAGKTVADLEAMGDGEVTVTTIIREHFRRYAPSAHWMLYPDDVLILQGEPAALERVVARAKLKLATKEVAAAADVAGAEVGVVEAVIGADSPLVGRTAAQLALRARYQVNVVAVSRSGARLTQRLRAMRFRAGRRDRAAGRPRRPARHAGRARLPAPGVPGRVARHRAQRLAAGRRPGGGDAAGGAAAGAGERRLLRRRGGAPAAVGC